MVKHRNNKITMTDTHKQPPGVLNLLFDHAHHHPGHPSEHQPQSAHSVRDSSGDPASLHIGGIPVGGSVFHTC